MAYVLRVREFPPLSEIVSVPQIVIIDKSGPAIVLGTQRGASCLVGEFTCGPLAPTEVDSQGDIQALYTGNGKVWPYFSQSAAGIQDGSGAAYNGNGMLALFRKTFQRLIVVRVDNEAVTTDGGSTRATLSVTVTVATADQDGASNTNKAITLPAGLRMGSASTFGASTRVFALAENFTIPAGTALTTNAVTVLVKCIPVRVVEPVVATAIAAIAFVLDPALPNVDPATTITAVNNATTLWPQGTGTTLATRLETQYLAAIDKTVPGSDATNDIGVIWSARRTALIRKRLSDNANDSASQGRGRIACVAADPAATADVAGALAAITAAIGLAAADGYVQPADRTIICFPASKVVVPDLGNVKVAVNSDGWMVTTLANFAEEVNPGAANPYVQDISELEDAFVVRPLIKADHKRLIAGGVAALYRDRTVGWQFMQGVTAASPTAYPTLTPIKRRRMADLIQDTLSEIAAKYQKQPATTERIDAFLGEIHNFLESLLSTEVPALQRIVDYILDEKSFNTADLNALGIYAYGVKVRTLPSMDFPVFVTEIGETVEIKRAVAAAA